MFPLLLLAVLTVRQDQTPLRTGCGVSEESVATLAAGTPVEVRFGIDDGSRCLKVSATVDGRSLIGYVPEDALTGMDQFDRARNSASSLDAPIQDLARQLSATQSTLSIQTPAGAPLVHAMALLQSNHSQEALALLEKLAAQKDADANVLTAAGLAAWKSDQTRDALDYWKRSLEQKPDSQLAALYAKVQREVNADKSGEKLYGSHVLVRYENGALPADTARSLLAMLDSEVGRISEQLGCNTTERLVAVVQTREAYFQATGAAEWSGGLYDGRIHIPMAAGDAVDARLRRTLAHETVHACLAMIPSGPNPWPSWLHEGLAQKLSGDRVNPALRVQLRRSAEEHSIPRLEQLGQNWSGLSTANAQIAYAMALAAVDLLMESNETSTIRNVLSNPERLPQITADLDKRLGM
jgi:tetratricopeptide (TPR) repeat protein